MSLKDAIGKKCWYAGKEWKIVGVFTNILGTTYTLQKGREKVDVDSAKVEMVFCETLFDGRASHDC